MAQINLHVTAEFEQALEALMQGKRLASKSEAIRYAIREAAAPYLSGPRRDFSVLEGLLARNTTKGKPPRPIAEYEQELDIEMERAVRVRKPAKAGPRDKR